MRLLASCAPAYSGSLPCLSLTPHDFRIYLWPWWCRRQCSSLASSEADLEKAREPTESAPASPLGAAVAPATPAGIGAGAGVGTGGRPPFHLERFPWGGRDQGGHPLSLRTKEKIKRGGAPWTMSPEGVLFGEDGNHFFCRCRHGSRGGTVRSGPVQGVMKSRILCIFFYS